MAGPVKWTPQPRKRRFLRHPMWALRVGRNRVRNAFLWRVQGRPTDFPVVISRPTKGRPYHLYFGYMTETIPNDAMWDGLRVRFPTPRDAEGSA